ncbi:MAG: DOMON-like domain-containing protein [Sphingomicrobium sp.]
MLIVHPDAPSLAVTAIEAQFWHSADRWHFRYLVEGSRQLILPNSASPCRADNLWQTTCFEAFVGGEDATYREFNFAPSNQWSAYAFDHPRDGMRDASDQVEVWLEGGEDWIAVEAAVAGDLAPGSPINLTAVIEEEGGHKSYWALSHPDGPPDFHNRDCFVAHLPPVTPP